MAHPYKRVKAAVSRSIEQLFGLQGISGIPAENEVIAHCLSVMQRAQAEVHQALVVAERVARRQPAAAAARPPAAVVAPRQTVAKAPPAGGREALPRGASTWVGRETSSDRDAEVHRQLPADSTAAEYVQQCMDDERGVHDGMAARELAQMPHWGQMSAEQQMSAIRARSLEMALADDMSDIEETLQAPAPAAPAPAAAAGDGVTF